ncbi:hypothetical protein MHBO_003629, partial [Bonamia ostreae]
MQGYLHTRFPSRKKRFSGILSDTLFLFPNELIQLRAKRVLYRVLKIKRKSISVPFIKIFCSRLPSRLYNEKHAEKVFGLLLDIVVLQCDGESRDRLNEECFERIFKIAQ